MIVNNCNMSSGIYYTRELYVCIYCIIQFIRNPCYWKYADTNTDYNNAILL